MTDRKTGNLFLDESSSETRDALGGDAAHYANSIVLSAADEIPQFVYFPHTGSVASVIRSTASGGTVEAGVVGSEGLVSVQSTITAPAPTRNETIVQSSGDFTRVSSAAARHHFQANTVFRDRVLLYTSNFLNQITQHAVCNRLHPIEQRLAKWLLAMRDRCTGDEMPMTHDFLSHMLGIHRPGVSIAIHALEMDGLVTHTRNRIAIRDRDGLIARTCECYAIVHDDLTQLRTALAA